jgi:hypothetical protein
MRQIMPHSKYIWSTSTRLDCNLFEHSDGKVFQFPLKEISGTISELFDQIPEVESHLRHFDMINIHWRLVKSRSIDQSLGSAYLCWIRVYYSGIDLETNNSLHGFVIVFTYCIWKALYFNLLPCFTLLSYQLLKLTWLF